MTDGGRHSYWTYRLRTERWTAAEFGSALAAEGEHCWAGYIGEPIFLCMEALANERTYGTSQCPFACRWARRDMGYTEDECPRTRAALRHMVTSNFNENYSEADILDIASAIEKTAAELMH